MATWEHDDPETVDPARPAPWVPPVQRVRAATIGRLRPWVEWFGPGRLAGAVFTVVTAVGVGWWLLRPAEPPTEATLPYATTTTGSPAPSSPLPPASSVVPGLVVVHIAGAVTAPGVYELATPSRVVDGVDAAGGATADADLGALNLAAVLADGQRVYVPRVGEPVPVDPGPSPPAPSGPAGPVDLNVATAAELDGLPGIGPATAAAIVEHRDANGPFATVDDLEAVPGIGPAKLAAVRDQVTT